MNILSKDTPVIFFVGVNFQTKPHQLMKTMTYGRKLS